MKLLLDTQALIWFLEGDSRLSAKARTAIEKPANLKHVSVASVWEMAIKSARGKLRLALPLEELFPGRLEALGLQVLPIQAWHLYPLMEMPRDHGDPFDRLLVAQALSEDFTVVGNDAAFDAYGSGPSGVSCTYFTPLASNGAGIKFSTMPSWPSPMGVNHAALDT